MAVMRKWAGTVAFSAALALVAAPVQAESLPQVQTPKSTPPPRIQGNLVLDQVPEIPAELAKRAAQYTNMRPARFADWAADGGLFILTRFAETMQLHKVATPLGARAQWTFLDEPVAFAAARPHTTGGDELVLGVDKGGSEFYQLFLFRRRDGSLRLLTDGKSRHDTAVWSADGKRLAFVGTGRNGKDFDVYTWAADSSEPPQRAAELTGNWRVADWSPDGKRLLVIKFMSIEESVPHLLDLASGKVTPLLPELAGKTVAFGDAAFAPDGTVWLTSDWGDDFMRLAHQGKNGALQWVTQNIRWNIELFAVSSAGKVALVVNDDGWSRLHLLGDDGKPAPVAGLPNGMIRDVRWSPDGKALAVGLTSPTSPGDVWTLRWESPKKAPVVQRWTEGETGGLDPRGFAEPTLVHYPTFDRAGKAPRQIPCFVYKPTGKGPFPFVINIHGGPEGQARPSFDPSIQLWLAELGVAVLVPNVRGSDGYGKAYLALDNGKKREDSVSDIGALLDWARTQPDLDPKRAAVYGGSYGGYMVLAALVHYGERLRAGVDIVGISNFVTFLENTQAYRRDNRRAEYCDEREPGMREFLQRISPLSHVDRIHSALFVAQGANDPRVPRSEAEQVVAAVRQAGKAVWYLLAKDEGHGFQKKSNREALVQAVALFWQSHLL
ncbi:MAG: S9 family peptidase [Deltaproteobacteria bacterium]|nr:S9 family peptidase [Deltaproteobacteria bacterium]